MNKTISRLIVPLAIAALVLSGCSDGARQAETGESVGTSVSASTPVPAEAPSPTPESAPCSTLSGLQAAQKSVGEVLPFEPGNAYAWQAQDADVSSYDHCAPLSWIVLPIAGPTGSSPYQIMLFNRGEFVQTATEQAYGFHPRVRRLSENKISVTYTWSRDSEGTADASGHSTSIFGWDDASAQVTRTGELPPGTDGGTPATSASAATDTGAAPAAGGPLPVGAREITTVQDSAEIGRTAYFKTPSGNIGCDFTQITGGCGVQSYLQSSKYGDDPAGFGSPWWIDFSGTELPRVAPKGDPPVHHTAEIPAQIIEYGQVLYFGNYACSSATDGLTCWNTKTGRGALMNKAGYKPF